MKLTLKHLFVFTFILFGGHFSAHSQQICIVTADFATGTKYVVYWEQLPDGTGLDSMIVYRQFGANPTFVRIGAVKVGAGESSFFEDATANTIVATKYAIAGKTTIGVIGTMSDWHQPIVNDYFGNGSWEWTAYQKENQVDESYITGYNCLLDMQSGQGFVSIGSVPNTQLFWTDANYTSHTVGVYVIEAGLPSCDYQDKAEINTSRSNIKQQISNNEASLTELKDVSFSLTPNPTQDFMTITTKVGINGKMWINSANGKLVQNQTIKNEITTIDVSNFEAGTYFVNLAIYGKITTRKFVKN